MIITNNVKKLKKGSDSFLKRELRRKIEYFDYERFGIIPVLEDTIRGLVTDPVWVINRSFIVFSKLITMYNPYWVGLYLNFIIFYNNITQNG